jgi:electron transport complex protein RnfG
MIDKSITKHGGLLALFALIATGFVTATYTLTKDRIEAQVQQQRLELLNTVVPKDYHDNDLTEYCFNVTDDALGGNQKIYLATKDNQATAFAIETTATNGYSGDIDMILGVTLNAEVLGLRVLSHKETPGLGDKIELSVSDWILSFDGKSYEDGNAALWKVKKDGGQFDQFTGATITPRAVVNTVAQTINWVQDNQSQLLDRQPNCEEVNNG